MPATLPAERVTAWKSIEVPCQDQTDECAGSGAARQNMPSRKVANSGRSRSRNQLDDVHRICPHAGEVRGAMLEQDADDRDKPAHHA